MFRKQQFVSNITCEALKVQVEFATSLLASWSFDELQQYFTSHVALKKLEANKSNGRSANYTKGGQKKTGKKSGKSRKARKVQRDNKSKTAGGSRRTGNSGQYSVPKDVWKTLSPAARDEIIASNRAARNANAATSASSSSTNNDSDMVNNYTALPNSERTAKLVGSKVAKRTTAPRGISTTAHHDTEADVDEPTQLTKSREEKSEINQAAKSILKTPKDAMSAGVRFGRANICRQANMVFSSSDSRDEIISQRVAPTAFARAGRSRKSRDSGHCIIDSGADTVCVGDGFKILSRTGRRVILKGFDDGKALSKEVKVVTAATAWDDNNGTTFILVFHEALDLGRDQRTSLLCPNQIQFAGHKIDDIPRFLTQGRSIHGIETCDEMYLPFSLAGHTSYLGTRTPTAKELDSCEYVTLTGDAPWDPDEGDWEELERKYT